MADENDVGIFSEEEQKEITAKIEAAASRDPVAPPSLPSKTQAAKRGLFPLAVNICALVLLVSGGAALFAFHGKTDVTIRETGPAPGITERALIREIRNEANKQLDEKEAAIDAMNKQIAGVDAELAKLDSLEALTDEQKAAMADLRRQQEEYRSSLATLQAEREKIIEDAQAKEAQYRAQLAAQQGEIEDLSAQSRAEIQQARDELAKLSSDSEKSALIERQVSGYFSNAQKQIEAKQFNEAAQTIGSLKEYLNTPGFQGLKDFSARKEQHLAAANALSLAIAAAQSGAGSAPAAADNAASDAAAEAALKQQLSERESTLATQNKSADEMRKSLQDLQAKYDAAQKTLAANQQALADKDKQIQNISAQYTATQQKLDTLQQTIDRVGNALQHQTPAAAPDSAQ